MKQQSKRATFLDVGDAQEKLRKIIDDCITNNKTLEENQREKFIKLLRLSTLGLGKDFKFIFSTNKGRFDIGHVHHAACWLAYQTDTTVDIEGNPFQIKELWYYLRDYLFFVFPHADTLSTKISQEQIKLGTATSGKV